MFVVVIPLCLVFWVAYATPIHPDPLDKKYEELLDAVKTENTADDDNNYWNHGFLGMYRIHRSTDEETSQKCGIRPTPDYLITNDIPFASRIVGGSSAVQRWPWQALLFDNDNQKPFCGGVLIGSQHVLTAAHCFDSHNRNNIDVIVGEHDRSYVEGTEQVYSIECLFIHSRYVPNFPYHNDIAMLKLETREDETVEITKNVLPVCLPEKGECKANTLCYITGWGYTGFANLFAGKFPALLQEAQVPLLSLDACQQAYGILISKQMQCAGFLDGAHRTDTCKGDSGGPLVCQDESGQFKLWGITSWGNNNFCSLEPSEPAPGVYTKVDKYLKWIYKKLTTSKCK
ncbi:chymotrypsin A-like [Amphiura filiformis]|uniref:chymotrypsin A-like n=1 Tax=Amphiura filiformis TaxID=82378 RepID=UPI003B21A9B3